MAVEYKDYYKILGVSKSAGKEEIAKSFKKLARKYHPDFNKDDKAAEDKFKEISEAYEVLKDDEKRRLYDQLGPDWQHGQHFQQGSGFGGSQFTFNGQNFSQGGGFGGSSFSDFFETLFGGGQAGNAGAFGGFTQRAQRGGDMEMQVQLSLEDAFKGANKTVSLRNADGSIRTLEVKIPAGVKHGAKIRLAGQGEPGGQPGDLFLVVTLAPHALFTVDETDVLYDLPLAPWEAVLGAKLRVPTLDGEVELAIPPGTSALRKFRIRGRGLGNGPSKGDQYVRVVIRVPDTLSPEERTLWEKLQTVSTFVPR